MWKMKLFLCTLISFISVSASLEQACVEGDLRLVGGIYYEGRLEICLNSEWGAVCGVEEYRSQIRNREVRDVACRQLGFPSSTRSRKMFSTSDSGTGTIHISEVTCSGREERLVNCSYTRRPTCNHRRVLILRCSGQYSGPVGVFKDRSHVYSNNSIIIHPHREISDTYYCITNRYPCCYGTDQPRGDGWFFPNRSQVLNQSQNSRFYQHSSSRQYIALYNSLRGEVPTGIFQCVITDRDATIKHLYIALLFNETGIPVISNMSYDTSSRTLICISTGGPATRVTWTKDNAPLVVGDGTSYEQSQIITDRVAVTYENRLVIRAGSVSGKYACSVWNERGNDTDFIVIPACRNGDTIQIQNATTLTLTGLRVCIDNRWETFSRNTLLNQPPSSIQPQTCLASPRCSVLVPVLGGLVGVLFAVLLAVTVALLVSVQKLKKSVHHGESEKIHQNGIDKAADTIIMPEANPAYQTFRAATTQPDTEGCVEDNVYESCNNL